VFFYSFYSNRNPRDFFAALIEFVCKVENVRVIPKDTPLHHLAARACQQWSYLVVLDGLEVLQHGEDDPTHYGWINDGELTEFVARVGEQGESLLVLTSRFPFPRITDEHPHHAREQELPLLDADEGADLLAACRLTESRDNLEAYSTQLGGHPLALRLFAGLCLEQPLDEPTEVIAVVRSPQEVESMPNRGWRSRSSRSGGSGGSFTSCCGGSSRSSRRPNAGCCNWSRCSATRCERRRSWRSPRGWSRCGGTSPAAMRPA
jgi:hypothetical protein